MAVWNNIYIVLICEIASSSAVCQIPDYFKDRLFLEYVTGHNYAQIEFRDDEVIVYTYDDRLQNGTCQAAHTIGRRLIYLHQSLTCHVITQMENSRALLLETKTAQPTVDACNAAPSAGNYFTLLPAVDQLNNFIDCPFTNAKFQAVFTDAANREHCLDDESSIVTVLGNTIKFEVCTSASATGPSARPATNMYCADNLKGSFDDPNADGGIVLLNSFQPSELFPQASHCARYKVDGRTMHISIVTSPVSQDRLISAYCMNNQIPTTTTDETFTLTLTVRELLKPTDEDEPTFWMFWLSDYTLYPAIGGAVFIVLCIIGCCTCRRRKRLAQLDEYEDNYNDDEPLTKSTSDRQRFSSKWSGDMSQDTRFNTFGTSATALSDRGSNVFLSYDKELGTTRASVDDRKPSLQPSVITETATKLPSSSPSARSGQAGSVSQAGEIRKSTIKTQDTPNLALLDAEGGVSDVAPTASSGSQSSAEIEKKA